jgi:hypothetical protein
MRLAIAPTAKNTALLAAVYLATSVAVPDPEDCLKVAVEGCAGTPNEAIINGDFLLMGTSCTGSFFPSYYNSITDAYFYKYGIFEGLWAISTV